MAPCWWRAVEALDALAGHGGPPLLGDQDRSRHPGQHDGHGGDPEHTRPGSRQAVRPHAPGDPTRHRTVIMATVSTRPAVASSARAPYGRLRRRALPWEPPVQRMEAMASLTKRIMKFVQSPQGQQLMERAKVEASKPENRRKLDQLRRRYLDKRR